MVRPQVSVGAGDARSCTSVRTLGAFHASATASAVFLRLWSLSGPSAGATMARRSAPWDPPLLDKCADAVHFRFSFDEESKVSTWLIEETAVLQG